MVKKIFIGLIIVGIFVAGIIIGTKKFGMLSVKQPELVVCSFGGAYQDAQRKALFEPFSRNTGIKIRELTYQGTYSEIKEMIKDKGLDIVDLDSANFLLGEKQGLWAPVDFSVVNRKKFIPGAVHDFGIASIFYSTVIAYSKEKYPSGTLHPASWADFWDLKEFPGLRALHKSPVVTLEIALLADGVRPQNLYPLDIDRAFKSLDKIKDHIVWWEYGQEPANLLAQGKVVLSSAWNGRIWAAKHLHELPLAVEWQQGFLDIEYWAIPAASKNKENAAKFIEFATPGKFNKIYNIWSY